MTLIRVMGPHPTVTWSTSDQERAREMVAALNAEYERAVVGWRFTRLGSRWARVVTVLDHERLERIYRNRAARKRSRMRRRGGR